MLRVKKAFVSNANVFGVRVSPRFLAEESYDSISDFSFPNKVHTIGCLYEQRHERSSRCQIEYFPINHTPSHTRSEFHFRRQGHKVGANSHVLTPKPTPSSDTAVWSRLIAHVYTIRLCAVL